MYRQAIILGVAIAVTAGCSHNAKQKCATTQPMAKSCETAVTETAAAPAPEVATDNLAGAWSLAMPRQDQKQASIEMIDDTHVKIEAGKFSGTYAVQGKYLLIVTRDEKMQPLAWKMNTADSLTVVRTSVDGADDMGVTLVRAAGSETASSDDESQWNADGTDE